MSRATGRLSFLYAALFFELGVNLPFFPLWLRASALEDSVIGIVLAAPLLTRIVANPVVAAFVDRTGRMAATLVACSVVVVLGTGLLALAHGFVQILLLVIVIASVQGPLIALTDALTLRVLSGLQAAELRYGRIRLWGSAGFALANIVAGWMLDWLPASTIIYILLVPALVTAFATMAIAGMKTPELAPVSTPEGGALERPWLLGLTIAGAALVQASHAAVYAFSALHWQGSGMSGAAIGGLWAAGVVSEIVLFSVIGHAAFGSAALLLGSAAVATIRWSGMALDPHLGFLVGLQLMQGVTFGMTHLGSIFLLARLAPASMLAQVQAWMAAGWAGAMAVLTALSGYLYESWGEHIYWLMAIAAGAGFLLLLPVAICGAREGTGEARPA
jgi:PPP family 3-phenylpropionic acid transporter